MSAAVTSNCFSTGLVGAGAVGPAPWNVSVRTSFLPSMYLAPTKGRVDGVTCHTKRPPPSGLSACARPRAARQERRCRAGGCQRRQPESSGELRHMTYLHDPAPFEIPFDHQNDG